MVVPSTDQATDDEPAPGAEGSTIMLPGGATLTIPPGKRGTSKAHPNASRADRRDAPRASDTPSPVAAEPAWIARLKADDYSGALELLRKQPGGLDGAIASAASAQELMGIATSARSKGGDPGAAQGALKRVIERFPEDPNASIAAYQLGMLHERMGQADQAKRFFAQCRSLAPKGPQAESALCAEVRIEKARGRKDEARRIAQEYLAKYPGGHCSAEVESILVGDDGAVVPDAAL
jgi:TolA-binding protein